MRVGIPSPDLTQGRQQPRESPQTLQVKSYVFRDVLLTLANGSVALASLSRLVEVSLKIHEGVTNCRNSTKLAERNALALRTARRV
jgi:hypothetical protein